MALIPPSYFNCVVALGKRERYGDLEWIGTGTLIGRFYQSASGGRSEYHVFIVTNKHVLENQGSLVVRFNPRTSRQARDYGIPLFQRNGKPLWKGNPDPETDVAAIGIDADFLNREEIRYDFFQSNHHTMSLAGMSDTGVAEGDFVYVLGFPLGIVAPDRLYVIARSGCIARLRDTLEGDSKDFLIDAMIFPGNSGGPVIYKPEIISIEGTRSVSKPCVLGIVSGYLTYKETALSQQSGQPCVVFEENSGLAVVVPMDLVMETIDLVFASMDIKETGQAEWPGRV